MKQFELLPASCDRRKETPMNLASTRIGVTFGIKKHQPSLKFRGHNKSVNKPHHYKAMELSNFDLSYLQQ